ncbi:unnamed protein product [Strongylus vulgaris]|uniref:VWF/SSPO/Zonadhesin-like cysteine-rich domain-containing protein n=1 Tax=Strongylus vulgaris TaxID=40348 RepID=A0A3P7LXK0_STRVU|nr:unnamed protein product [Strongylus vulgaris]
MDDESRKVPDVVQFQGNQTLCGIGGNLDNNYKNDVVYRNGTVFQITNNPVKYDAAFNHAEDSWITTNFLELRPNAPACVTGEQASNLTNCDSQNAATVCAPIQAAMSEDGPFSDCYVLGNDTIQAMYDNCVYDVCHAPEQKCNVLQMFARTCQAALDRLVQPPALIRVLLTFAIYVRICYKIIIALRLTYTAFSMF